jgi:hypothetical protein
MRLLRVLLATLLAFAVAIATAAPAALLAPESASSTGEAIERAVDVVLEVAGTRRLILLGELHGTREVPALAAALTERYAAEGPVVLAVEIDHAKHRAIDAFIGSNGGPRARARLRDRAYWSRGDAAHDGRRNDDLLELFERVRRLRRDGHAVAVLAFDVTGTPDHHARDRGMATVLRAAYGALPRGRLVVVAGNVHAMLERPRDAPAMMQVPAGAYLRDLDPVSLRITARTGAFWACLDACGPLPVDDRRARTGPTSGAYHHVIVLPRHRIARLIGSDATR